jgi:hypothetical protein
LVGSYPKKKRLGMVATVDEYAAHANVILWGPTVSSVPVKWPFSSSFGGDPGAGASESGEVLSTTREGPLTHGPPTVDQAFDEPVYIYP